MDSPVLHALLRPENRGLMAYMEMTLQWRGPSFFAPEPEAVPVPEPELERAEQSTTQPGADVDLIDLWTPDQPPAVDILPPTRTSGFSAMPLTCTPTSTSDSSLLLASPSPSLTTSSPRSAKSPPALRLWESASGLRISCTMLLSRPFILSSSVAHFPMFPHQVFRSWDSPCTSSVPPWLLPPSAPPWSMSPTTPRPSPKPPPLVTTLHSSHLGAMTRLFRGGRTVTHCPVLTAPVLIRHD
ncbi:uncharacterized protein [Paramisgurnus dabryanus]|uniref:uncharacterized protein n=1 Tax=Paramisgurnus dabryanus TaxID=90735 RepID=UPI0031F34B71